MYMPAKTVLEEDILTAEHMFKQNFLSKEKSKMKI